MTPWSPGHRRGTAFRSHESVRILTPTIVLLLMRGLPVQFLAIPAIMARTSNDVYLDLDRLIGQAEP